MDKNSIAVAVFNKLAKEYQDKFMDVNLYGDSLDFFCAGIEKRHAAIIEVACGPGNITSYLLNKRPDFDILGTDLSPRMLALAATNNPTASFLIMDCRNIKTVGQKYDGLVCGFALPYLSKEEAIQFIRDAAAILHPKGLLYVSTMEDAYSKSGIKKGSGGDEIFMHYHEAGYLIQAMEENNFTIIQIDRKEYDIAGVRTIDLILIAEKNNK